MFRSLVPLVYKRFIPLYGFGCVANSRFIRMDRHLLPMELSIRHELEVGRQLRKAVAQELEVEKQLREVKRQQDEAEFESFKTEVAAQMRMISIAQGYYVDLVLKAVIEEFCPNRGKDCVKNLEELIKNTPNVKMTDREKERWDEFVEFLAANGVDINSMDKVFKQLIQSGNNEFF